MTIPGRAVLCGLVLLVAACAAGAPSGSPSRSGAPPSADAFAGRSFRMDLPAGWAVMGTAGYDASVDSTQDVAAWLKALDLVSPNAFRAHEPQPGAGGLRLAINPWSPWSQVTPRAFQDQGAIEALPGVARQTVTSVWVGTPEAKGFGYSWTQSIDWGTGTPTARDCVGYQVMGEFDPVDVVFSWPAGTGRLKDVDALMATFHILGNATWSLAPGVTLPPSPTPFDKLAPPAPMPTFHGAPDLEALLPDSFEGRVLGKESRTGDQSGMTPDNPLLQAFGKQPSDLATAQATPSQPPLLIIGVQRLRGVRGEQLLAAMLQQMPNAKISHVTLSGRVVTYVVYGAWPVWYWASGDLVYGVVAMGNDEAASVFALLR